MKMARNAVHTGALTFKTVVSVDELRRTPV
jgi:hypothetical protein